jgi:hypothetical protein
MRHVRHVSPQLELVGGKNASGKLLEIGHPHDVLRHPLSGKYARGVTSK